MRCTSTPTIERIRTSPIAMYDFFCFMMPVLTGARRPMFRVFNELHVGGMNCTGTSRSACGTDTLVCARARRRGKHSRSARCPQHRQECLCHTKNSPPSSGGESVPHSSGERLLLVFV